MRRRSGNNCVLVSIKTSAAVAGMRSAQMIRLSGVCPGQGLGWSAREGRGSQSAGSRAGQSVERDLTETMKRYMSATVLWQFRKSLWCSLQTERKRQQRGLSVNCSTCAMQTRDWFGWVLTRFTHAILARSESVACDALTNDALHAQR